MREPHELYELVSDLPELHQPVLIHALAGFVDAGSAGQLAREHLLSLGDRQEIARFDLDQLLDYRSRRPLMLYIEDHWESYDEPGLILYVMHDQAGTPYLLLDGPEPDLQWERFIAATIALVRQLDVRMTVGLQAIPMAVPHTRPVGITAHATRRELIPDYDPWLQRVQVPANVGNLLEFRLGQQGLDAAGFAAHVPHYLAQNDYPAAAEALVRALSRATGLVLPTDALAEAATSMKDTVDAQVAKSTDVAAHVLALEQQYDSLTQSRQGHGQLADLADLAELPTAEELGAEFERFLAEQAGRDNPPTNP